MNQIATTGIVLSRLNYGEADKIITVVTPDNGKLRMMARGVRKVRSKLAGGIELFSVSNITYIPGKKDICTLVSTRLQTHFGHIAEDLDRTMAGYDIIKIFNQATEDECGEEYYELLLHSLAFLNETSNDPILVKCWFMMQLLRLLGHTPNVERSTDGSRFSVEKTYGFSFEDMGFYDQARGSYSPNHIKMLRLLLNENPDKLHVIHGIHDVLPTIEQLLRQTITLCLRA